MSDEQDKDIVIEIADAVLNKYKHIHSMNFDKGHWRTENRALLELEIPYLILPKLGKLNEKDRELEGNKKFRMKNCSLK